MPVVRPTKRDIALDNKRYGLELTAANDVDSAVPPTDRVPDEDRMRRIQEIRAANSELGVVMEDDDYGYIVGQMEAEWEGRDT